MKWPTEPQNQTTNAGCKRVFMVLIYCQVDYIKQVQEVSAAAELRPTAYMHFRAHDS
jgi:hypothetical protein